MQTSDLWARYIYLRLLAISMQVQGNDRTDFKEKKKWFIFKHLSHTQRPLVTSIINSKPRSNYGAGLRIQTLPKQSLVMSKMM